MTRRLSKLRITTDSLKISIYKERTRLVVENLQHGKSVTHYDGKAEYFHTLDTVWKEKKAYEKEKSY